MVPELPVGACATPGEPLVPVLPVGAGRVGLGGTVGFCGRGAGLFGILVLLKAIPLARQIVGEGCTPARSRRQRGACALHCL